MKTYVLYHDDADGFCAAWCAWRWLGDKATYLPVQYNQKCPLPEHLERDATVYILDFSYPRKELDALAQRVSQLVVLDHHASAEKELAGAPWAHYDNEHSGAWLAWRWFAVHMGGSDPARVDRMNSPKIVSYVEDRDLWRFALPDSHAINAWLGALPNDFQVWNAARHALAVCVTSPALLGSAILQWQNKLVMQQAANAVDCHFSLDGFSEAFERVPLVNATLLISETGNELCRGRPFSATWFTRQDGARVVSLRSDALGLDVSEIAFRHGGGGHKHAAGFVVAACDDVPWEVVTP